jgi:hypothetical protein
MDCTSNNCWALSSSDDYLCLIQSAGSHSAGWIRFCRLDLILSAGSGSTGWLGIDLGNA